MRSSLLVLLATTTTARADAKVDWATGLVTADGVGIADRHAPSPAVARGTSRRGAEEAAKRALAAKIATLPLAIGGTVGERAKAAVDGAFAIAAEPETDGATGRADGPRRAAGARGAAAAAARARASASFAASTVGSSGCAGSRSSSGSALPGSAPRGSAPSGAAP